MSKNFKRQFNIHYSNSTLPIFNFQYMIALAELHLLNQDLDACQSILQTVLKNNKDNDQATLVRNIHFYDHIFLFFYFALVLKELKDGTEFYCIWMNCWTLAILIPNHCHPLKGSSFTVPVTGLPNRITVNNFASQSRPFFVMFFQTFSKIFLHNFTFLNF